MPKQSYCHFGHALDEFRRLMACTCSRNCQVGKKKEKRHLLALVWLLAVDKILLIVFSDFGVVLHFCVSTLLQMTCQDVSTMLRYGLNPIIFLVNNLSYTIEVSSAHFLYQFQSIIIALQCSARKKGVPGLWTKNACTPHQDLLRI